VPLCVTVIVWPAAVTTPVRVVPGFGSTTRRIVEAPLPVVPVVMLIQLTLAEADQLQSAEVCTLSVGAPPAEPTASADGSTAYVHGAAAAVWVIMTAWPATFTRAVLGWLLELGCTLYVTVPAPCPEVPPVIVIQLSCGAAVQPQTPVAFTVIEPAPPPAVTDALGGETV